MTRTTPTYWFPAKRYGWGWGPPRVWQGWLVLAGFFVLFAAGILILPRLGIAYFLAYCALLCVALMAICWIKGERPSWRGKGG